MTKSGQKVTNYSAGSAEKRLFGGFGGKWFRRMGVNAGAACSTFGGFGGFGGTGSLIERE